MEPKIAKKTQDTLGRIIKKPPLTEKLLSKPPFRFLHDIFTEVIRTTGFLKGLFSAEEMDSKNVTAKESKIIFLQKVVDCVSFVSGETLSVRPSKVIAGHEPENTNELLQTLARCIRKKLTSDDAVQMVLEGKSTKQSSSSKIRDKPPSGSQKQDSSSELKETSSENQSKSDRSSQNREKSSDRRRRSSSKHKERDSNSTENVEKDSDSQEKERRRHKKQREETTEHSKSTAKTRDDGHDAETSEQPGVRETTEGSEDTPMATRGPRPASAKGQRRRPAHNSKPDGRDDGSEAESNATSKKLARPPSARPAAPRVRQRKDQFGDERIDSGGPQRSAPIIVDRGLNSSPSDEDEQFVVEEESNTLHSEVDDSPVVNGVNGEVDDEAHGGLVNKILETKKELESAAGQHSAQKHTEIQRPNVTTAQQKKEREMVLKEIEELRNSVQKLCQSAAPLAKIIDYIQEDMDAMQNELKFWKKENNQHAIKLKEEEGITHKNIEPLNIELQELEQSITSYRNQMAATKANIIRNDEKIRKMVVAVATRS